MRRYSRFFSCGLIILAMVLMWLSAHDLYVSRINQQQQNRVQSLKAGHHHLSWALKSQRDLVSGFGSGWRIKPQGLEIKTQKAEISLAFENSFIVPENYPRLNFEWAEHVSENPNTRLQLEFSQVDSGVYYYSPTIELSPGHNSINLAELVWTARQGDKNKPANWQDLPLLNTLVWRFSQAQNGENTGLLKAIKLPQTTALNSVNQTVPLAALLNNTLRQSWHSQRLSQGLVLDTPPVLQPYWQMSPWILFGLSGLLLIPAVIFNQPLPHNSKQTTVQAQGGLALVVLVCVLAFLMQTVFMWEVFEHWPWLVMMIFITPVLILFKRWIRPHHGALPVWLLTIITALVLVYIGENNWGFASDLPLYLFWALAQQVILGPWVSDYLHQKAGLPKITVVLLCGVLFAMLHTPNQMLMLATFIGGVLWSYAWLRYHNIYANTVSHALLALLFYQTMPEHVLGTARVGLGF
ncbi:MAG: lysostaphin resistance A-like protein [Marinicella pacifica]